jgi:hypothetical protein
MDVKKGKIGIGELLFGLIIVLGIVGTISFFAFDEFLGEHQTTFMIVSSLAFIASFFVLSVYARAKKRSHPRRVSVDRAVVNWIDYIGTVGSSGGGSQSLPAGTLESIAIHVFTINGYRLDSNHLGKSDGFVRFLDKDNKLELIQCRRDTQPLGLREVIAFYEVFHGEKAAWGEIWAPAGFLDDAVNWVDKRPITLRDAGAIHQLVESLVEKDKANESGS